MTKRECPQCEKEKVLSRLEARRVFQNGAEVNQLFDRRPEATHACSTCGSSQSHPNSSRQRSDRPDGGW